MVVYREFTDLKFDKIKNSIELVLYYKDTKGEV